MTGLLDVGAASYNMHARRARDGEPVPYIRNNNTGGRIAMAHLIFWRWGSIIFPKETWGILLWECCIVWVTV